MHEAASLRFVCDSELVAALARYARAEHQAIIVVGVTKPGPVRQRAHPILCRVSSYEVQLKVEFLQCLQPCDWLAGC
ncbi:hypothetical protein KQH60_09250 [Mycetohabitans sp. B8]|uniref:hypothetical protein n=1 Tax=Mycetohabitans sp. B8 TaxID=2841845 RepID=UPI001F325E88|nr:hypothetical protein [Mycetohabitans sp. B8]MCG1042717.1 hypothetical protein [Mycetohabitans sp. B8]